MQFGGFGNGLVLSVWEVRADILKYSVIRT